MYSPANASGGLHPAELAEFQYLSGKLRALDAQLADITVATATSTRIIGEIAIWALAAPPTQWRILNGDAISRTTYQALFELWGTAYGAGDGLLTFNIPDFRGKFPLGKAATGTGATLGSTGGEIDHRHDMTGGTTGNQSAGIEVQAGTGTTVAAVPHTHAHGNNTTHAENPPFIAVNYIVYTGV
jgi:hypothetical protein